MRYYSVKNTEMSAIADAIRVKTGKADGMTPAQMSEEISNIPDQIEVEEVITPLNMADGDMMVLPTDGKAISKVVIQKPETLTPENIAKDVDIAGVVGTLKSGGSGGGMSPYMFVRFYAYASRRTEISSSNCTVSVTIPANATILACFGGAYTSGTSTSSSTVAVAVRNDSPMNYDIIYPTITVTDSNMTIAYTDTISGSSGLSYRAHSQLLVVVFTLPGLFVSGNEEGTLDVYADKTFTAFPVYCNEMYKKAVIRKMDLSKSSLTAIEGYTFYYPVQTLQELLLPPSITSITNVYFSNLRLLDLSLVTSVPTLSGLSGYADDFQILVPAELYNEFIAATNWSAFADYIVAV